MTTGGQRRRGQRGWWPGSALAVVLLAVPAGVVAQTYDFAYRLSGDRRVAPVQVFDDGRQTWLQFAPGQVMPAVFVRHGQAPQVLAQQQQQGPYLVLEGTADQIDLRIGDILARADYLGQNPRHAPTAVPAATPLPVAPLAAARAMVAEPVSAAMPAPAPLPPTATATASLSDVTPRAPGPGMPTTVAAVPAASTALEFDAALSDRNMRRVLERWSRQAGWMFAAEHWTVDVDIPLVGAASFGADFRNAVRGLLAATELGERPLQPCFYANRVVRVVAWSQPCDRTVSPLAASGGA